MRQASISVGMFGFNRPDLPPDRFNDVQRELVEEVKSVPGVLNAATTTHVPLLGGSWGHGVRVGATAGGSKFTWVGPGYFATMGIPITAGRDFTLRDTRTSPRVAVVNEAFVRTFGIGHHPIGQTLRTDPEPQYPSTIYEIVGVIPDTKYNSLRGETTPMAFAPDSQLPALRPSATVMIYANVDPQATIAAVRNRLRRSHPEIVMEFFDFQTRIRDGLIRERLLATLAGIFGAVAACSRPSDSTG